MKNSLYKKGLMIVVFLLFIGISFRPAFASEISISTTFDNKDDCNCNDEFINIPESIEQYEELLDFIKSNRVLDGRIICDVLGDIVDNLFSIIGIVQKLIDIYPSISLKILQQYFIAFTFETLILGYNVDCWDYPFP